MLSVPIIASLLATTTAFSIPRAPIQLVWSLSNFRATGSRFSISTTYSFAIDSGSIATTCFGSISTLPMISYLPVTKCANPIYSFSFQAAPNATTAAGEPGYNVQIWEGDPVSTVCSPTAHCVFVGQKFFPKSDVVTVVDESNPNGNYDYLNAPSNFTVEYKGVHI